MPEDAETLCTILSALYPSPQSPIDSLQLALRCAAASRKYHLRPSLFKYDHALFEEENLRRDAFTLCVLAWNSGQWRFVKLASRYLNGLNLITLFPRAMTITGGAEVLAALMHTHLERRRRILQVVERLPEDLLCIDCRAKGRHASSAFVNALEKVFAEPFPNPSCIYRSPTTLASEELLRDCPSYDCFGTMQQFAFSPQQAAWIEEALARVPRVIVDEVLYLKGDMEMCGAGIDT